MVPMTLTSSLRGYISWTIVTVYFHHLREKHHKSAFRHLSNLGTTQEDFVTINRVFAMIKTSLILKMRMNSIIILVAGTALAVCSAGKRHWRLQNIPFSFQKLNAVAF